MSSRAYSITDFQSIQANQLRAEHKMHGRTTGRDREEWIYKHWIFGDSKTVRYSSVFRL